MRFVVPLALAAVAAAFAAPAAAQFAKPEDAVKYRQSALFVMSQHFGRIGAMVQGRVPFDAKVAADNADVVAQISRLPWAAFVPASDKVGNTRAKPEIWAEQAKFKEYNERLMADTAKTNDLNNLRSAFQATAGSCKACHDAFRNQ